MEFKHGGRNMKFMGASNNNQLRQIQGERLGKIITTSGSISMLQVIPCTEDWVPKLAYKEMEEHTNQEDLKKILDTYTRVFENPRGLPLAMLGFDHQIPLKVMQSM